MTIYVWPKPIVNLTGIATETTLSNIETLVTTIESEVDGLETAAGLTNTKLDTIIGHVDQIEGYVDGLETAVAATNTRLGEMSAGLVTAKHDSIVPTFNATSDVWEFKLSGVTQQTVTINYVDATKAVITSVVRT